MLDLFTIFSKGGIVLWYYQGTAQLFTYSVNELIKSIILQERGLTSAWNHNTLSLQYKLDNEFELVFVVAYQNILQLTYIDKFLDEIQLRFRDKYKQAIQSGQFNHNFSDFRIDFDATLRECEEEARMAKVAGAKPRSYEMSNKANRTVASMIETKTGGGILSSLIGGGDATGNASDTKKSGKGKKAAEPAAVANGNSKKAAPPAQPSDEDEEPAANSDGNNTNPNSDNDEVNMSPRARLINGVKPMRKFEKKAAPASPPSKPVKKGKAATKWEEDVDQSTLDRSDPKTGSAPNENTTVSQYATKQDVGKMKGDLQGFLVESNDVDDDDNEDDSRPLKSITNQTSQKSAKTPAAKKPAAASSGGGGLFSSLKGLVGSKVLTKEAIQPVMEKMQEHLVSKNVASEIAQKICDNVSQNLEGKQMSSFQFVTGTVKQALQESMVQILTPKKRVDILRDVYESQRRNKPYVIVFCGVNGVGKSTNLAKVTFWLIENSFRVLIAACDTFRSGAVEQLRTHMKHLNALHSPEHHNGKQMVELFEKGYGKDAASIANDAINYAQDRNHDVVLVDTAGRMQDNEPLMKALAKLININSPDLVLFVGEALVGNEAVDQVRKFNQALIDNSPLKGTGEQPRTIDGIVLTKFDTIDDKVGAAISMTYTTGQPIVFVGTGQTYSDLKSLNAQSVVQSLLR